MDPVELAQQLVRIASLSGEEAEVADLVERTMKRLGYRRILRTALGSVVGVVGPTDGRVQILFDGHMDVVPAGDGWSVPPFSGLIRDGRLYGRGSSDMKGGLAAAICGVADAARGGALSAPVAVSATVLEEVSEGIALAEVLDQLDPQAVLICESTALKIFVAQRGRMEIVVTAQGRPSHTAHPDQGTNPIALAVRGYAALEKMLLPGEPGIGQALLVSSDIISEPYPAVTSSAASVRIRYHRRTIVGEKPESILRSMADTLAKIDPSAFSLTVARGEVTSYTGRTQSPLRSLPAWCLERTHPLIQALESAIEQAGLPVKYGGVFPGCTNASESAGVRRIPTAIFGPGIEAHVPDESVPVEEIRTAHQAYRNLALRLAGPNSH
jgi:putative selenium metabolism hydrolase